MGKTKGQNAPQEKIKKMLKYSLQSPYFNYYETMPSKNSKNFVNITLVQALYRINEFSNIIIQDKDTEPQTKKQKLDETMNSKYGKLVKVNKELAKQKILSIGLNQT